MIELTAELITLYRISRICPYCRKSTLCTSSETESFSIRNQKGSIVVVFHKKCFLTDPHFFVQFLKEAEN